MGGSEKYNVNANIKVLGNVQNVQHWADLRNVNHDLKKSKHRAKTLLELQTNAEKTLQPKNAEKTLMMRMMKMMMRWRMIMMLLLTWSGKRI